MKVLIVADYEDYGGVDKAATLLQRHLEEGEHAVERYSIFGQSPRTLGRFSGLVNALAYLMRVRCDRAVLMHFDAVFVGILARALGSKQTLINVMHTDVYEYYDRTSVLKKILLRLFFLRLKNELMIFVSQEAEQKARRRFGFRNTKTIYNAIEPVANPHLFAKRSGKDSSGTVVFGSVARLYPTKNIDVLIRIFNHFWLRHTNAELWIFGEGPESMRLKAHAGRYACAGAVKFKGYIKDADEIYSQIDGLVGFSDIEGFGLAILEALARNVPVLYSDCSCGPREILRPGSPVGARTQTYEKCAGGILVKTPPNVQPYSFNLNESDDLLLEAFEMFWAGLDDFKRSTLVGLSIFEPAFIKKQWNQILFPTCDIPTEVEIAISTYGERVSAALLLALKLIDEFDVTVIYQSPCVLSEADEIVLQTLRQQATFRFFQIPGTGVAKSRNLALLNSRKKYLWFLDDDVSIDAVRCKRLLDILDEKNPDVMTVGVLDETGMPARYFPRRVSSHNKLSILSVGTIEIIVNTARVKAAGCRFPEDMGAGTNLPVADEPVFLARCLDAGLTAKFHPLYLVIHPKESSGTHFLDPEKCRARGVAFGRIFSKPQAFIFLSAMYIKKGFGRAYAFGDLCRGYRTSLSALFVAKSLKDN